MAGRAEPKLLGLPGVETETDERKASVVVGQAKVGLPTIANGGELALVTFELDKNQALFLDDFGIGWVVDMGKIKTEELEDLINNPEKVFSYFYGLKEDSLHESVIWAVIRANGEQRDERTLEQMVRDLGWDWEAIAGGAEPEPAETAVPTQEPEVDLSPGPETVIVRGEELQVGTIFDIRGVIGRSPTVVEMFELEGVERYKTQTHYIATRITGTHEVVMSVTGGGFGDWKMKLLDTEHGSYVAWLEWIPGEGEEPIYIGGGGEIGYMRCTEAGCYLPGDWLFSGIPLNNMELNESGLILKPKSSSDPREIISPSALLLLNEDITPEEIALIKEEYFRHLVEGRTVTIQVRRVPDASAENAPAFHGNDLLGDNSTGEARHHILRKLYLYFMMTMPTAQCHDGISGNTPEFDPECAGQIAGDINAVYIEER